ncbi:hypothetical protein [Sulfurospirillum arcachonense]|uniref:hypothetical protein n=1 Tax=Sulfurospirillum arcachonense TaxID=57666 RepID=UPI00046A2BB1|nr:hypothetical protein [Sulfurospirillum arcachonense]
MERNFCLLIFFTCNLISSENFWFSYKSATTNKQIVYEERNISPLMLDSKNDKYKFLCKIDTQKKQYQSTLHFLNENFNKLLPCFYPMSTQVISRTLIETKGVLDRSVLTITPTQFTVDFKDQFANISVLR